MNATPIFLHGGKNAKFPYFLRAVLRELLPWSLCRARRESLLASIQGRSDRDEIEDRAAYCCRLDPQATTPLPADSPRLRDQRFPKRKHVYYFDTREFLRYFPRDLRWSGVLGDTTIVPPVPSIVKSRPIAADAGAASANANSVLLSLNKVRHFTFVNDRIRLEDKIPQAIFRGVVHAKPKRIALFEKFFGQPGFDLGDISSHVVRPEWIVPEISIADHLRYRFILCIEGNDVASNLKWVMSSNSIAVMPRPEFETWFLEGQLVPGVHYIEVAPDYSDLVEKLAWYSAHLDECSKIVAAAHRHVARFADPKRECLVSLRVLDRYFKATGQMPTGK